MQCLCTAGFVLGACDTAPVLWLARGAWRHDERQRTFESRPFTALAEKGKYDVSSSILSCCSEAVAVLLVRRKMRRNDFV